MVSGERFCSGNWLPQLFELDLDFTVAEELGFVISYSFAKSESKRLWIGEIPRAFFISSNVVRALQQSLENSFTNDLCRVLTCWSRGSLRNGAKLQKAAKLFVQTSPLSTVVLGNSTGRWALVLSITLWSCVRDLGGRNGRGQQLKSL